MQTDIIILTGPDLSCLTEFMQKDFIEAKQKMTVKMFAELVLPVQAMLLKQNVSLLKSKSCKDQKPDT